MEVKYENMEEEKRKTEGKEKMRGKKGVKKENWKEIDGRVNFG